MIVLCRVHISTAKVTNSLQSRKLKGMVRDIFGDEWLFSPEHCHNGRQGEHDGDCDGDGEVDDVAHRDDGSVVKD